MASSCQDTYKEFKFFMRCTICLDTLTSPRTLPCLHTFCTSCLQCHVDNTLATTIPGDAHFTCPTCREQISLPRDGVSGFRRDFRMEQVREIMMKSSDVTSDTTNEQHCNICQGEFDSSAFYCRECRKRFCDMCSHVHSQIPVFTGHHIMEHDPQDNQPVGDCPVHPRDTLAYICQDCVQSVCSTCVIKLHGDHVVVEKHQGIRDMEEKLDSQHRMLLARRTHLISVLNSITEGGTQVRRSRDVIANQVKVKVRKVIDEVHRQERKLLQELEQRSQDEESRLSSTRSHIEKVIRDMSEASDAALDVISRDPEPSLIQDYHSMEQRLGQLVEDSLLCQPESTAVRMTFVPSPVRPRLGRMAAESVVVGSRLSDTGSVESVSGSSSDPDLNDSGISTPEHSPARARENSPGRRSTREGYLPSMSISLIAKLGRQGHQGGEFNMPRDVCFIRGSNHFAVCDTNNERLQVFDVNGLLVNVIGQGRVRPWGVTSSSQGELMVADNVDKCVKVYDTSGELQSRLGSFLCPCGISITSKDHVVVTDFFSTCAYVIDGSGEIRRQVRYRTAADKHACGASRVAVTSHDDIIISDVSNASLKAYNRHGRHLWTVCDYKELMSPQGVCVTKDDVIIVGDCVNHRLVQFNIRGEFLGTVNMTKKKIKEPTSLALSRENLMVIGRMKANQIRVYVINDM